MGSFPSTPTAPVPVPAPIAPPTTPAPVTLAPISAAPVPAPVTLAPISAAPISAAPVSAAPVSAAPVSAAPVIGTPTPVITTSPPVVAPVTSAPVVAPVSGAPVMAPVTGAPVEAPVVAPVSATSSPTYYPVTRINAGGGAFTDTFGNVWQADDYFMNGGPYNAGGVTMPNAPLYTSERYFNIWVHPQPFLYEIPVPASGDYATVLHFAETFFETSGQRVFDVWVEGNLLIEELDIFAETGYLEPLIVSTVSTVTDGALTVEFVAQVENPKISGLEVMDARQFVAPTAAPTVSFAPSAAPTTSLSPTASPAPTAVPVWKNIYINCGGPEYVSNDGLVTWQADDYFTGGGVYVDGTNDITPTADDPMFHTERYGTFTYEIPVEIGNYEITVHLAELYHQNVNARKFKLTIEDSVYESVDIVQLGGGVPYKSVSIETVAVVADGFVTIAVEDAFPKIDQGKVSGIEIKLVGPHLAHSVANGPYRAVDITGSGTATFLADGTPSHTHATGATLSQFIWKQGANILGTSIQQDLTLPVGEHIIALTVIDSDGNENTEATTATILPFGYPAVTGISPTSGSISGGDLVTITGAGFTYSAEETIVHFGLSDLTGNAITIVNANTITVVAPATVVGAPVAVSVETPLEVSNSASFNYLASVPINFDSSLLFNLDAPTVAKFGPDRHLYIGTIQGKLARVILNDDYTTVVESVISTVAQFRCILGIAFDPMDTKPIPDVYITSSFFFHGSPTSSSGQSINGDVRKISGANLDVIEVVISGIPVSDHDHGATAAEFGFNGELYVGVGSNTNGGKPGQLTGNQLQKEGYYSAAILKAEITSPNFDGAITYDALDDGSPNGGVGISVFSSGLRNPYGAVMHSNGKLYGTDNGPNLGYGDMTTGCGPNDFVADIQEEDKLVHLKEGEYYGHPNPKRASDDNDPRQCVWRSQLEPSDAVYTAPLLNVQSSTDGIIEFSGDHFEGQLRGNLIISVYQGALYRVILTPNGEDVIPQSKPAILLVNEDSTPVGYNGLDVCQAPNGNLVEVRTSSNALFVHEPNEPASSVLTVKSVFPTTGGLGGGYPLDIYGINFPGSPTVTIQGLNCPVVSSTSTKIVCTVPAGSVGISDVVVSGGGSSYTFTKGFRHITGAAGAVTTPAPTSSPAPTSQFAVPGAWVEITPSNSTTATARHEACFVMVGRLAVLIGGRNLEDVDIYDPVTRTWTTGVPGPPTKPLHHMQCVAVDDKVYILSAWTGYYPYEPNTDSLFIFDPIAQTWATGTPLPLSRRRGGAAAVVVGRDIYLSHGGSGGHEQTGEDNAQTYGWLDKYNVDTDTWTIGLPDAPHPRDHTGGALVNGNLLCVSGGRDGGTADWPVVPETDCFDLTTQQWVTGMPDIPVPRAGAAYGTTCDGKMMIAGGEANGIAYSRVDVFDGVSWETIDSLNLQRHGTHLAVDCLCAQIHIAAGAFSFGGIDETSSLETYFYGGVDTPCLG